MPATHDTAPSGHFASSAATPLAQAHSRTRIAHDADDHAHNLSRWEQRYNQFSFGRFEGQVTELTLPDLQVFLESANQALHQSCAAWPDAFWIGIPYTATDTLRMDSQLMPRNTLLLCPGGEQFDLQTPENSSLLGLVVGKQLLGDYLAQVETQDASLLEHQGALQISAAHFQALSQALLALLSSPAARSPHGLQATEIYDAILGPLGAAISAGAPPQLDHRTLHVQHSRRLVSDVCDRVLAQPDQRLSIADLCRQVHVSRRTLQYAFQEATGLAPLAYLRMLKLNQVRRGLRAAQTVHPVTLAATNWGFEHLGQFSQDYRKLFGESPSTTACRSRF